MIQRRLALLATTAIALVSAATTFIALTHTAAAQSAPTVLAQAQTPPEGEKKHEGPPGREPPPKGKPPQQQRPATPPPPAKPATPPPHEPTPPAARPPHAPPPPPPPAAHPPAPPPPPHAEPPARPVPPQAPKATPPVQPPAARPTTPPPPPPPAPPTAAPSAKPVTPPPPVAGQPPAKPATPPPPPAPQRPGQPPTAAPNAAPAPAPNAQPPGATPGGPGAPGAGPNGTGPRTERRGPPPGLPPGTPAAPAAPQVAAPLPSLPPPQATPLPANGRPPGGNQLQDFRAQRQQTVEGGRTIIREPDRVIVVDPSGQSFIRHDEDERFRYGARNVEVMREGADTRTVIVRPDGVQIITVTGPDGGLLRRIRRGPDGREVIIIDNTYRDPRAVGGFYVELPPPVLRIPPERYIVEADVAPPALIYDTLMAPPVERLDRRFSLDEIRYSPAVRQRMPSIDLDTITFDTGSADIGPEQAAKLQVIADGLNRAVSANPREVFLIEGHTDATGNDVDNLSLSDRRAESVANLLSQQFQVPAENLTTQGYGSQYLKVQTDGPERRNRRVTVRRITPLLTGDAGPPR